MALLDFKASKLYRQTSSNGYTDDDGDYHPGVLDWEFECKCDVVPAGAANQITLPDGTSATYSYNVYNMPPGTKKLEEGDIVKLILYGGEEVIAKVKGFHRYQYQCRLWV